MLTLRSLSGLDSDALLALWNAAYAGYLVPLQFDRAMLERHIRRSGIDLRRSVVGAMNGQDFGLSLAAFRDRRAWIGGFGVDEAFRRRGLATRLMNAHLEQLDADGVDEVWLEVIDSNPAREVYRRCGFGDARELRMFEGAAAPGVAGEDLPEQALAERHAALHRGRPAWRRDLPTLMDAISVEGASILGVDGAFALAIDQGERLFVFDAAAADPVAAGRLLGALAERWPGKPLRLVDEPTDSPMAAACLAAGLSNPLNQFEMVRRRPDQKSGFRGTALRE